MPVFFTHGKQQIYKFYELDQPIKVQVNYPYTGMYQFVPLLKSKEWPISKIFQLVQLHVTIVDGLRPLFIENLQDINNVIDDQGNSLMQGFYGMTVSSPQADVAEGITPTSPSSHSIHNTQKHTTKVILLQSNKFVDAVDQFSNIHNILQNNIKKQYHMNVFISEPHPD
jgi:hypothetical protein